MEQSALLYSVLSLLRRGESLEPDRTHVEWIRLLLSRAADDSFGLALAVRELGDWNHSELTDDLMLLRMKLEASSQHPSELLADIDAALFSLGRQEVLLDARQAVLAESRCPSLSRGKLTRYVRTLQYIGQKEDIGLLIQSLTHHHQVVNWILTALRSVGWRTLQVRLMLIFGIPEAEINSYLAILCLGYDTYFPERVTNSNYFPRALNIELERILGYCESPLPERRVLALLAIGASQVAKQRFSSELAKLAGARSEDQPPEALARQLIASSLKYRRP